MRMYVRIQQCANWRHLNTHVFHLTGSKGKPLLGARRVGGSGHGKWSSRRGDCCCFQSSRPGYLPRHFHTPSKNCVQQVDLKDCRLSRRTKDICLYQDFKPLLRSRKIELKSKILTFCLPGYDVVALLSNASPRFYDWPNQTYASHCKEVISTNGRSGWIFQMPTRL